MKLGFRTCKSAWAFVFQPVGDKLLIHMDIDLLELFVTPIHELMWYFGRNDNDLTGMRVQCGRTDRKGRYAFLYDKDLFVGMLVQSYRTTGRHVNPDK